MLLVEMEWLSKSDSPGLPRCEVVSVGSGRDRLKWNTMGLPDPQKIFLTPMLPMTQNNTGFSLLVTGD
jgi:hypothetical protein